MDEEDLQAIAQLIARQKHEIINEVKILIEADITPKFNLLADGILSINEKLILRETMDIVEDWVDDLEKTVDFHTQQIDELRKAQ